jgi:hypothetical protein
VIVLSVHFRLVILEKVHLHAAVLQLQAAPVAKDFRVVHRAIDHRKVIDHHVHLAEIVLTEMIVPLAQQRVEAPPKEIVGHVRSKILIVAHAKVQMIADLVKGKHVIISQETEDHAKPAIKEDIHLAMVDQEAIHVVRDHNQVVLKRELHRSRALQQRSQKLSSQQVLDKKFRDFLRKFLELKLRADFRISLISNSLLCRTL